MAAFGGVQQQQLTTAARGYSPLDMTSNGTLFYIRYATLFFFIWLHLGWEKEKRNVKGDI